LRSPIKEAETGKQGRIEMHRGFWWGNPKERNQLKYLEYEKR
jgi:hypothetical protein